MPKKSLDIVRVAYVPMDSITSFGEAYLFHVAEIMTATALKTKYDKSANDHIREIRENKSEYDRLQSHLAYIHSFDSPIMEIHTVTKEIKVFDSTEYKTVKFSRGRVFNGYTCSFKYMEEHDVKIPYTVTTRITKDLPRNEWYDELRLTKDGEKILACPLEDDGTTLCVSWRDVLQTAWIVLSFFRKNGMIVSYDSVWNLSKYVYRAINTYLENHMNHYRKNISLESLIYGEDEEEEQEIDFPDVKNETETNDTEIFACLALIKSRVFAQLPKKVNKNRVWEVLEMRLHGMTLKEIQTSFKYESRTQVDRYLSMAKKAVYSVYYCQDGYAKGNDKKRKSFKIAL